jgi:predicted ATPase
VPLTSLIGREHELRALLQQLQSPGCRLLNLTGPGGIGKTRLALEAAYQLQDRFEDGVCFISLVGTGSPQFIIPAIADALGFSFSGAVELKAQLFNYLREKHILIVLDNLEHLLAGIELLDELLAYSPRVKLLTTSREQLNLRAEWGFEVQGLPVPSESDPSTVEANSAAALFIQRARQTRRDFTLASNDVAGLKRICQLVEGSPLGLELAATWVRLMSVQEIASEIERSMDFLTSSVRDLPERHRSIRAVFDHSWSLLSEEERRVMMRLSVFRGGFTREAAEHVAGASLAHLSALVQKSLLRHAGGAAGRYDLHELIRQYAVAQLQMNQGEDLQAHERHAGYFAAWLEQQESELQDARLHDALTRISQEIDNLRCAWDWMVSHCLASNLRQSLVSLFVLHDIRNWIRQGAVLFEQAAAALQSRERQNGPEHTIVLGELMTCQGHMCWHLGDLDKARDLFQRSLRLLGPYRDCPMLAELLMYLSLLEHSQGDYTAARRLAEECVSLNREQGRVPGTAYSLSNLGMVCLAQGEYETAYACLQEGVAIMRSIQHARGTAITLTRLGAVTLRSGRLAESEKLLEESLEITRRFNDRWGIGNALNYLGLLAAARGDLDQAESLIRESVNLFEEDGDLLLQASTLTDLGHILSERRERWQAWNIFQQALQIALRIRVIPTALYALAGIAKLYAREGLAARALELVTYIREHPSGSQQTKDYAKKLSHELMAQAGPRHLEAARSRARVFTLEDVARDLPTPFPEHNSGSPVDV